MSNNDDHNKRGRLPPWSVGTVTILEGSMTSREVAIELRKLVFTAARDYKRKVVIDRDTRDLLVAALERKNA